MAVLLIREDEHGVYARTNGEIFRPQPSVYSYGGMKVSYPSSHRQGDKVKGGHLSQSPHARVGTEIWSSHGSYVAAAGPLRPSTECWKPAPPRRPVKT